MKTNAVVLARLKLLAAIFLTVSAERLLAADQGDDYAQKIERLHYFDQPLVWTGSTAPDQVQSKELWEAIGAGAISKAVAVKQLETFVHAHPDSPWVPSLRCNLANYYCQNGYFTPALENWQAVWKTTKQSSNWKERMVADDALAHWLQLLSSLGRTETMKALFDETQGRQITPIFHPLYRQARGAYAIMLNHPEISYRCGTYAMSAVAGVLGATNYFHTIWEQPSPPTGFSMSDLVKLSDANHLNLVPVQRTEGDELVTPSVLHWKQNHYAAIVARKGDLYEVVDPTFRMTKWLRADAINAECSGQFLVSAGQVPSGWRSLNESETSQIFGKGFPQDFPSVPCCPSGDCPCGPGTGGSGGSGGLGGLGGVPGCSTCSQNAPPNRVTLASNGGGDGSGGSYGNPAGMPDWTVTEPGCDLWLRDEPLAYQPAKGPKISFKLFYSQEVNNNAPAGVQSITSMGSGGTMFTFGGHWYPSWLSFVQTYDSNLSSLSTADLLAPGGGVRSYTNFDGTVPEFSTSTRMLVETNSGGDITGFRLLQPAGAVDVYEQGFNSAFFLTQQIDERGNATTFVYSTNDGTILLQDVIDGDGKTNTLAYTNVTFATVEYGVTNYTTYSNNVSQITDPSGRTVKFKYPGAGGSILTNTPMQYCFGMTNIVDVAGISSSFKYADSIGTVTQLTTPYGNTSFYFWTNNNSAYMILVTEPNGSHQMFFYTGESPVWVGISIDIPTVYTDTNYVPTSRPMDNPQGTETLDNPDWSHPGSDDNMQLADSFYWGRQQFADLSTNFLATAPNWNPTYLKTNDFTVARLRHWNETADFGQGNSLSMERESSPNGKKMGEMTWYDYPGKPDYFIEGSSGTPTLIIKVLPGGSESYVLNQLDQWNHPTNVISTYSVNGTVLLRTNRYVYDANGIDLLMSIGPDGVTDAAYAYDSQHQVLAMTNALGEVTRYAYNAYEQLTSITQPNGLVTTNIYGSDGYLAQQIVIGFSTNSYTYINGLVCTHTDERGLTLTNSWDALGRLTSVAYPDGTSVTYTYSNLDLVKVTDRMGLTTSYGYNGIRQKIAETNALGNATHYDYCECGALESVMDAMGNATLFTHDNQGNLTKTVYPDGFTVYNNYNLIHKLIGKTDSGGMIVSNYFNNQGLLMASSNNVGRVQALAYDINDLTTNSVDANGVGVSMTYDNLHRLLTRSYPDGGVEKWGYAPSVPGATSYTNQIGNVVLYGYDALNRKTSEIYVGITTNQFAYNGAGDLLTLTDGKNDATTWGYDSFGRVTNKVDAANNILFVYKYDPDNRLTNRWSAAKSNTVYSYNAAGNLTHVAYPVSPAISLSYDPLNRLTNMVDAVGTTVYGYDAAGQLLSEDGPWANDTVSYTYNNRLRSGLNVQAPNASTWAQSYGYDSTRRLTSVSSPAGEFNYTYDPSQLQRVDELALPNGAYITNSYDNVSRLLSTALVHSGGTSLDSYAYGYNQANQRTNVVRAAGDSVGYTYDNMGELTAAIGKEVGGTTNRLHEQFGYSYDAAGNLNQRTNDALVQNFGVNNLNELTAITRNGTLTVSGRTTGLATNVTVNTLTAALYQDWTFAKDGFTVTNGDNAFTAIAKDGYGNLATNTVTVNLPATNNYSYDLNGNLLSDGTRGFAYDDENELTSVYVTNVWREDFVYDGKMRRRITKEFTWNGSAWSQTNTVNYVYDGNLVIQERDTNNLPLVTYTRGNDLSGTLQGAGGIGGLLARTDNGQLLAGSSTPHTYYHADGNGNITMLINPNQFMLAKYLYDPFGNTVAMSGSLAAANTYRFSSKEWDDKSGLYYYLYRFYDSNLQRWPNRDPLGTLGFDQGRIWFWSRRPIETLRSPDLYTFSENRVPNALDPFGLLVPELLEPAETLNGGKRPIHCRLASVSHGPGCGNQGPPSTSCQFICTGGGAMDENPSPPQNITITVGGNQPCSSVANQAYNQAHY